MCVAVFLRVRVFLNPTEHTNRELHTHTHTDWEISLHNVRLRVCMCDCTRVSVWVYTCFFSLLLRVLRVSHSMYVCVFVVFDVASDKARVEAQFTIIVTDNANMRTTCARYFSINKRTRARVCMNPNTYAGHDVSDREFGCKDSSVHLAVTDTATGSSQVLGVFHTSLLSHRSQSKSPGAPQVMITHTHTRILSSHNWESAHF